MNGSINKKSISIQRQFHRSAASYDAHAAIQRMMSEQLEQTIAQWKSSRQLEEFSILEVGCGTGALTERLASQYPSARLAALDLAPAMLSIAEQRILQAESKAAANGSRLLTSRICFVQADIEAWAAEAPPAAYDLIVSNACFQWLNDAPATLRHLRRMLRSGGLLVFSTFGPATFRELHQAFDEAYQSIGAEPRRHGLSFRSAAEWSRLLHTAEFAGVQEQQFLHTELYDSPRAFLHEVKAMGASASEAKEGSVPGLRRLFTAMEQTYERRFRLSGGIQASYEFVWLQAHAE
ncbi:malonyl-ACP O-methyltransferase BioC [Paenibacillus pasadenensis]|uniref:malonyl-ACP O-methyltransferase BioC n=1 Tax=Paenibacillus pasadenensis TaxID=217090 RepID=UPI00203BB90C|nr:malonyl-ACP O-methyltransferase BioC [Paenibacillus pasadenensis]MCM3748001.1 malonyl-ACP O-methyltransferase BioC [Paenibacillus pasadenensis]